MILQTYLLSVISRKTIADHRSQKKILFVDNEPDMTALLKMALEYTGFSIEVFNDPLLVLKNFKPNQYDQVVLDVLMPKMDGLELYNQLKDVDPISMAVFRLHQARRTVKNLEKRRGDIVS